MNSALNNIESRFSKISRITSLAILLNLCSLASAQSGEIVFKEKMDMHRNLPEGNDMLRSMLPRWQENSMSLLFTPEAVLYSPYDGAEDEDIRIQHEQNGMDVDIQIERPETRLFFDLKKSSMVQAQEFFGRQFLIIDEIPEYGWKITGERKEVAGHSCIKATWSPPKEENAEDEGPGMIRVSNMDAVAWFTTDIPVSAGPMGYGQLPGMILEMDLGDGTMTLTAEKINLRDVNPEEIGSTYQG